MSFGFELYPIRRTRRHASEKSSVLTCFQPSQANQHLISLPPPSYDDVSGPLFSTFATVAMLRSIPSSAVAGPSRNYNWLPQSPTQSSQSRSQSEHVWNPDEVDVELGSLSSSCEPIGEEPAGFMATRPVLRALLKLAALFVVGSVLMGGTLWLALPPLDE